MRHETTFDESEQSFQQKLDFSTAAIQASLELGESPIVTTKFATYSVVLLHMTAHEFPSIPVV